VSGEGSRDLGDIQLDEEDEAFLRCGFGEYPAEARGEIPARLGRAV